SHDLRNPLTVVVGRLELLRRYAESAEAFHPSLSSQIEQMEAACMRMNRIIQDLSDASKVHSGTFRVNMSRENIDDILEKVTDIYRPLAIERGIELSKSGQALDPGVWCDRDRVVQVLSNLLDNAFKFTPPGGGILIEMEEREDEVEVRVVDTGV